MRTRVESRVHDFLGLPYLGRHRRDMSLLVGSDEGFRILEPGGGHEESSGLGFASVKVARMVEAEGDVEPLWYTYHTKAWRGGSNCPHLGSAISADCLTRPQYVVRSY